jgi:hypothetical protein
MSPLNNILAHLPKSIRLFRLISPLFEKYVELLGYFGPISSKKHNLKVNYKRE